ncbi:helix-turn-helix domain-containing protein [Limibacterium fermenti]|jgi:transcriptional regulator with XRE-family HTH domain|uniref:helix-turn-helix domain-containing protein n=1 Tax=Limibacterium fermenti TaxID=3229863 RepID=UPI000E8CB5FD|nr:transcriptional regulator [Porphyromonadaceae bacterium]HBX44301.1 transcriptional regulator [Porphyromonadaceae bacterium]
MGVTYEVNRAHLGYNVKRLREILGVKQEDLAERMQLSQQSISKLENKEELDNDTLEKVADALNIPSETIKKFTDEGAIHIISNTFSDNASINNYPINNPIERIVQLYDDKVKLYEEKVALYERMLKSEQEKTALLEELVRNKPDAGTKKIV